MTIDILVVIVGLLDQNAIIFLTIFMSDTTTPRDAITSKKIRFKSLFYIRAYEPELDNYYFQGSTQRRT